MVEFREPLKGDDNVFGPTSPPPGFLPVFLRRWALDLTYDEVHAFVIGMVTVITGAFVGEWALLYVALHVAYRERKAKGFLQRTIRNEPWYWGGGVLAGTPIAVSVYWFVQLAGLLG